MTVFNEFDARAIGGTDSDNRIVHNFRDTAVRSYGARHGQSLADTLVATIVMVAQENPKAKVTEFIPALAIQPTVLAGMRAECKESTVEDYESARALIVRGGDSVSRNLSQTGVPARTLDFA